MAPTYPTELADRIKFIMKARKEVIVPLALQGKRAKAVLDQHAEPHKTLFQRLDSLLSWLESTVQISPELKKATQIDDGLKVITQDLYCFSDEYKARAAALLQKWEDEHWGGPPPPPAVDSPQNGQSAGDDSECEEEENGEDGAPAKRRRMSKAGPSSEGIVMKPPYDHPIWGKHGIMHGLALKKMPSGRKSKGLNPEYKHLQRPAKGYGHNDITVGRWFPYQLCAVFHGAHGESQGGITPGPLGAYSVIVSGIYDDLDRDIGESIFYSGSGSHQNTDPARVPAATAGTKSLHQSIATEKPVRVLRSHSGNSSFAPYKGLRYDGLYKVVEVTTPKNTKGGWYERFHLVRLEEDQKSLQECKVRPNGQDLRDFDRIELGYHSRRE